MTALPSGYSAALPRKRKAAGVLIRDHDGRVLLVEPVYKDYWEIPGGCVEADESPYAAAVRVLKEELRISVTPGRLLVTDWVPPRPGRKEGVVFVFDGGILEQASEAEIQLCEGELRSWAWSTAAEAKARLSDLLARRVQAARRAAREGITTYLEDGNQVA